uniref:TRASH domain-containing protein n=1 Tax=Nothobranchius kadleci TaxID=1051664 RepID=A0A1A8DRP6_NOTKA
MDIANFVGGPSWCLGFMRRRALSVRTATVSQQLPADYAEQKLELFRSSWTKKMADENIRHITNMDELVSGMVDLKTNENVVLLFCSQSCIASYKLQPQNLERCQNTDPENTNSSLRQKQTGTDPEQESRSGDGRSDSNAAGKRPDAARSAETDDIARLIIQADDITCFSCFKRVMKGCKVYQLKRAKHLFCSASCVTELYPQVSFYIRKCFSCLQLITQPQKVILAPVDDSGTMRELCSEKCLSAVNSAQLQPRCKLCNKSCSSAFSVTVGGEVHRLCSNPCFTNFNKEDKSSWFICEICSSLCSSKRLVVKMKDNSKTVCGYECLVKLKEKAETSQPCPTCCTSHQLSDMVEKENDEGELDFFCSYRCMKVHKVQFCPPSDQKKSSQTPSSEEVDVKDVKPLMQSLLRIKEEPADEEFSQDRCDSVSSQEVKQEPDVPKEDLKISSVFSLLEDQKPAPSFLTQMDLNASCSTCQRVLMDGETVYQRKAHKDLFCSTSCLLKYYQMKSAKKTCHFCLQVIMEPQSVLHGSVDDNGTKKDFCSQICLSSFNYKRIMSNKLPVVAVASHSQCSVCSRYSVSKHEVILQDVVHKICSDPCFHRFCNINSLFMCENCGSRCNKPLRLKLEDGTKSLCGAECLTRFKQKIQTQQPCSMCRRAKLLSETVESRNGDVVELFCSKSCVTASKIQAVCASGAPLSCDNCSKTTVPVCHLAMWDASIRNFCSLTCAMVFRETQKDRFRNAKDAETQDDGDKPPEGLPCAQCQQIMQTAPTVIQNKNQLSFVCSSSCSQEFKRINDITGVCEHCKSKRIIKEVKKVDSKNHNFCSDGCFTLFLHGLEMKCKKFCSSCCFCRSVSKTVVTSEGQKFCSEGCRSKNKLLLNHLVKCDTCHRRGKLTQSLPLLGHVRRFCDLRCLLHFCRQEGGTVSSGSPPPPEGAVESSPVITNVMSLSNILKRHLNASSGSPPLVPDSGVAAGLLTDIQTRVVGHAGVQTTPTELKNKSTVCVPLVHNKGVCCCVQTVETGSQTVGIRPKVIQKVIPLPVPVPVPIYVPLALNMYSQYAPTPAVLPVPLPVPLKTNRIRTHGGAGSDRIRTHGGAGSDRIRTHGGAGSEDECEADTREENEEHRQLSFANVVRYTNIKQNGTKVTYLCFYPPTPADQNQSDADGAPAKKRRLNANSLRMKENTENLLRCPVRLYEFYLSKCSESIRRHGDLFYLQPDPCCVPSSPLWFSAMPLDDATIEAMIVRTRAVRLQQDE